MPFVFDFDHPHRKPPMEMKDLLGGKGANLAEMTSVLGLPVPPGFTITTDACRAYMEGGWPEGLTAEIARAKAPAREGHGQALGDAADPLLVSVRSGAKFSMPGMMDTVLNLGLNDESVEGPGPPDRRRALRLRLVPPLRRHVRPHRARHARRGVRHACSTRPRSWPAPTSDAEHPHRAAALPGRVVQADRRARTPAHPSPRTPTTSCGAPSRPSSRRGTAPGPSPTASASGSPTTSAPPSTSRPWCSATATTTRAPASGFTRDPATGAKGEYGDFLVNAQGEDVVAGIRNTEPLSALRDAFPKIHKELLGIFARLEHHYRDMCDTEFTIEQGKLWMLQTRVGKRTGPGRAADGRRHDDQERAIKLTRAEAVAAGHRRAPRAGPAPAVRRAAATTVLVTGLGASPGAAVGRVYLTADDAAGRRRAGRAGHPRPQRDLPRGRPRHARRRGHPDRPRRPGQPRRRGGPGLGQAGRGRGRGRAHRRASSFTVGDVDGRRGRLDLDRRHQRQRRAGPGRGLRGRDAPRVRDDPRLGRRDPGRSPRRAGQRRQRARRRQRPQARGRGHRAVPHRAHVPGRGPPARRAPDDPGRQPGRGGAAPSRRSAWPRRPTSSRSSRPWTACPSPSDCSTRRCTSSCPTPRSWPSRRRPTGLTDEEVRLYEAAKQWHEFNPMLGTRGVRLGVIKPGLYAMQVRALMEAALDRVAAGGHPVVEIMIPLTVTREELALARSWVEGAVAATLEAAVRVEGEEGGRRPGRPRGAHRHHDRDAPGRPAGRRDRRGGRLLLASAPTT